MSQLIEAARRAIRHAGWGNPMLAVLRDPGAEHEVLDLVGDSPVRTARPP